MFDIFNKSGLDLGPLESLIHEFMPFAKERYGFKNPPKLFLLGDEENAANPLGRTGGYNPDSMEVTIYVTGRHPKDILRSLSHELVHHNQNERGDFSDIISTALGYAQEDPHMREMEREAYEQGNLCFRDWEDGRKKQLQESIYYETIIGGEDMSDKRPLKEWKDNEINFRLMKKFGLVKEDYEVEDGGAEQLFHQEVTDEKKNGGEEDEEDEEEDIAEEESDVDLNEQVVVLNNEAAKLLNEDWARRWIPDFLQPEDDQSDWGTQVFGLQDTELGQQGKGLELENPEAFSPERIEHTLQHYSPAGYEVQKTDEKGDLLYNEDGTKAMEDVSVKMARDDKKRALDSAEATEDLLSTVGALGAGFLAAGAGPAMATRGFWKAGSGVSSSPWAAQAVSRLGANQAAAIRNAAQKTAQRILTDPRLTQAEAEAAVSQVYAQMARNVAANPTHWSSKLFKHAGNLGAPSIPSFTLPASEAVKQTLKKGAHGLYNYGLKPLGQFAAPFGAIELAARDNLMFDDEGRWTDEYGPVMKMITPEKHLESLPQTQEDVSSFMDALVPGETRSVEDLAGGKFEQMVSDSDIIEKVCGKGIRNIEQCSEENQIAAIQAIADYKSQFNRANRLELKSPEDKQELESMDFEETVEDFETKRANKRRRRREEQNRNMYEDAPSAWLNESSPTNDDWYNNSLYESLKKRWAK